VSFEEIGLTAMLATVKHSGQDAQSAGAVSEKLLPQGEPTDIKDDVNLEYWMTLNYAKELLNEGKTAAARAALEHASTVAPPQSPEIKELYSQLPEPPKLAPADSARGIASEGDVFAANMQALRQHFPDVAKLVLDGAALDRALAAEAVEAHSTPEGMTLWKGGQCLDHVTKPVGAAQAWVKRTIHERLAQKCKEVVVVGMGCGYHIELLSLAPEARETDFHVSVIEPSAAVFSAALHLRDQRPWISKVRNLVVGTLTDDAKFDGEAELFVRPAALVTEAGALDPLRERFYGSRGLHSLHPRVAVLGPMQGGTLPMTGYVNRALAVLGQRGREMDMSCFVGAYHGFADLLKDKLRQAVIQNQYIETLSQAVVESVREKPVDILFCMAQAPISGKALDELRKMGVITVLWFVEDYLRFTYWKGMAQFYDFVFTIQRGECLEVIRKAGAGQVQYVPVGCDPAIHRPVELTAEERARWGAPISFVGAGYHNRQQLFASLADMPFKIWGTEWPDCRPFDRMVQEHGRRLTPEEYNKIFSSTDINLNLHSSTEKDGVDPAGDFVNPRTFELAAAGAFQLVDHRSLLGEVFTPEKEVAVFHSGRELKDRIEYFTNRPDERHELAQRARERAQKEHTYAHRMRQMLEHIYRGKYHELKRREQASPWTKMLQLAKLDPELQQRCDNAYKRGEEPILDGLVSDIVLGQGKLTPTEQKLMFLYHVRKQTLQMRREEGGG
jgi:spore maturation protein CgeB